MEIAARSEAPVVRPPNVLVPLIKKDLEQAREAERRVGLPYYQAAGGKLIEAKSQMDHGEFIAWTKRNFDLGRRQAAQYMSIARATSDLEMGVKEERPKTLRDIVHEHTDNKNYGKPATWRIDVDKARTEAKRLQDENLSRRQEREAERKLALRLIDIGFKVLIKELHPDKGGTKDAMARLNRVRGRLKDHA